MRKTGKKGVVWQVAVLWLFAVILTASGLGFTAFSLIRGTTVSMMGYSVSTAVFGAVAAFLGVRYLLSVGKLQREVEDSGGSFNWGNFKRTRETVRRKGEKG